MLGETFVYHAKWKDKILYAVSPQWHIGFGSLGFIVVNNLASEITKGNYT